MSLGEFDQALETAPLTERKTFERELLRLTTAGRIENLLEDLNLSQSALAERLGKSRAWVSKVLSGRQNVTLDTLAEIGIALGVRFSSEMVAAPRAATPAAGDPPLPTWVHREEPNRLEWTATRGMIAAFDAPVASTMVRRTYISSLSYGFTMFAGSNMFESMEKKYFLESEIPDEGLKVQFFKNLGLLDVAKEHVA